MTRKPLHNAEWLKLAAAKDGARPVLCTLHVTDKYAEATDSYRLHRWIGNTGLAPGLWDAKTGAAADGQYYPQLDRVLPTFAATHEVTDVNELRAVVAAAIAYGKESDSRLGHVTFRVEGFETVKLLATYVNDVLRAAPSYGGSTLRIMARGKLQPVMFEWDKLGLQALIMSVRDDANRPSARFDLTELVRPLMSQAASAA